MLVPHKILGTQLITYVMYTSNNYNHREGGFNGLFGSNFFNIGK